MKLSVATELVTEQMQRDAEIEHSRLGRDESGNVMELTRCIPTSRRGWKGNFSREL